LEASAQRAFAAALAGEVPAPATLTRFMPGPPVDGYWHGRAGLEHAGLMHISEKHV